MLAEEDKSSDAALEYWFRCCDVDGDGFLNAQDMLHFYRESPLMYADPDVLRPSNIYPIQCISHAYAILYDIAS